MAFTLDVPLAGYEYRAMRTGQGERGMWMSLVFESPEEARQCDVSVPKDMQSIIYDMALQKGDICDLQVRAYAGSEYSRITLKDIVVVCDANGEEV